MVIRVTPASWNAVQLIFRLGMGGSFENSGLRDNWKWAFGRPDLKPWLARLVLLATFDSRSIFGAIVDQKNGGYWSIVPHKIRKRTRRRRR
jgi:hypothetical protein